MIRLCRSKYVKILKKIKIKCQLTKEKFDVKIGHYKKAEISVADLILKNSKGGELLRLDMIVRLLAIENYYGKNNIGIDLYRKMQNKRVKIGYADEAVVKFKELIESYEENGYDEKSFVLLDKNFNLIDGSHRIALAIYYEIPNITAYIVRSNHTVAYSIDWFFANGFTENEICIIVSKAKEVLKKLNRPFSCVIWAPAVSMSEKIISNMKYFGEVISYKTFRYRPEEYNNIVRAIYAIDDIEKWKIEKKIEHMRGYDPQLVAVELKFDDPEFRVKKNSNLPLSKKGERVKNALRKKYKEYIENYFFDIAIHIGDNLYQSEYMKKVFEPGITFRDFLFILNEYEYAIAKLDSPYLPLQFPNTIPIGKDVDIICQKENALKYIKEITDYCDSHTKYHTEIRKTSYGIQLRLSVSGKVIFIFDFSWEMPRLNGNFVSEALSKRILKDDYYVLRPDYDYVYRLNAYVLNKTKRYHLVYLRDHYENADKTLIKKFCGVEIDEIINKEK